jgi:hypothetical protein
MSQDPKAPLPSPLPVPPEQPEGLAFEKYLQILKRLFSTLRKFDYRRFFQDILTFLSILGTSAPTQWLTSWFRCRTS